MATKPVLRRIRTARDRLREVKLPSKRTARAVKCIAYPNRSSPRLYQPADVGRIVCGIVSRIENDATTQVDKKRELRAHLDRCFPCIEEKARRAEEVAVESAVTQAAEQNANSNTTILIAVAALLIALLFLLRFVAAVPLLAVPLAGFGIRTLISRVVATQTRVTAQRAANDGFILRVRQAANEGLFRRAANQ